MPTPNGDFDARRATTVRDPRRSTRTSSAASGIRQLQSRKGQLRCVGEGRRVAARRSRRRDTHGEAVILVCNDGGWLVMEAIGGAG
jgi:hypothetical protein